MYFCCMIVWGNEKSPAIIKSISPQFTIRCTGAGDYDPEPMQRTFLS